MDTIRDRLNEWRFLEIGKDVNHYVSGGIALDFISGPYGVRSMMGIIAPKSHSFRRSRFSGCEVLLQIRRLTRL